MMRRLLLILVLVFVAAIPAAAQQDTPLPPTYSIRSIRSSISNQQISVQFEVLNNGGPTTQTATAALSSGGAVIAEQSVPPVRQDGSFTVSLPVPPGRFLGGSSQSLTATVTLVESGVTVSSDTARITVQIPADQAVAPPPTEAAPEVSSGLPFGFDPNNTVHIVGLIAALGALLVLVWVITIVLRLLFRRPEVFPPWQPPYVHQPLMDPNSTAGRRQLWQQHAQSDALPLPCAQGSVMIRKLLVGSEGGKLAGWRVTGIRASQYDRYGRVARTQVIAGKGTIKSLDRAVRKSADYQLADAEKAVAPVARAITRSLFKKMTAQTAALPSALDIRLSGAHGEVRIIFELYHCVGNGWQQIDRWEPEMTVVNGRIEENFTYALFGHQAGEPMKQYRERFQDELQRVLAAMVLPPPPPPAPPAQTAEKTEVTPEVKTPPPPETIKQPAVPPVEPAEDTSPNKTVDE